MQILWRRLLPSCFLFAACARPPARTPALQQVTAAQPSPLIIAHRGASGHRPEHTLEGYALAIVMGADYIEPDLVSTRDGVLVARHENEIGATTNAAVVFPERRTSKLVDGDTVSGWFVEDFTFAELRTLRARERLAFRSHEYDGQFAIPSFEEVLQLADSAGKRRGRVVGVYPELKHPTYFRSIGLALEPKLLAHLAAHGLNSGSSPVFIQCFEMAPLRALRSQTSVRLIQLLSSGDVPYDRAASGDRRTGTQLATPQGLRDIATYAFGVGVNTRMIVGGDSAAAPTHLIADAHAAGLAVHVWTLRPEANFLARRYAGDPLAEVREFARLGVDGIFGDYPDLIVQGLGRHP